MHRPIKTGKHEGSYLLFNIILIYNNYIGLIQFLRYLFYTVLYMLLG